MNKQKGLSLIEIMVALVISTILVLGVTDLFGSAFLTGRTNSQLAYVQESGRLSLEVIGSDARRAGLWSCSPFNWEDKPLADAINLSADKKTLTIKYVSPDDCDTATAANRAAKVRTVIYAFNSNGLQQKVNSGTAQTVLDDVSGQFELLPAAATADKANGVRVTLTAKPQGDANVSAFAARTFSTTFEFKNRTLAKD